ncbi:hypothetical protein KCP76_21060 [Salmonella enterica subsp. enterica serovar Weltevreden]|nr:hypothetical protein KCP76_21060 [Salmonella enterica subsp. enterica serovar Weltevreden]
MSTPQPCGNTRMTFSSLRRISPRFPDLPSQHAVEFFRPRIANFSHHRHCLWRAVEHLIDTASRSASLRCGKHNDR